ncbi:MAG TPA: hypothetical protein VHP33_02775 [Polyangiaceae bacterium]|nr:hypothetical protein [Polyangiaceae bacterium]
MTKLREFDRIELDRLRRMQRSHAADRLNDRELSRRVAQFGVRRPARGSAHVLRAVALAAAATSLALGAFAASGALGFHPFSREAPGDDARSSKAEQSRAASGRSAPQSPAVMKEPSRDARAPQLAPVASVAPLEIEPSAKVATPSAPRNQRVLDVVSVEVASGGAGRAWTRAAEALRRGDHSEAEQALGELSRSAEPATRDAALLAQAELDLGAGSSERAVVVLRWLAEHGATPFVRTRAQQILTEKK